MRARTGVRCATALVALSLLAGCGERVDITGSGGAPRPGTGTSTGTSGGGTSGAIDARLVGQWSRTLLFQDDAGAVQASRTTWRFGSNATASRAVVASNLTFGFVDSVVTHARWRIQGGRIALTFLPPSTGEVLFDYRFESGALLLGGIPFVRQ